MSGFASLATFLYAAMVLHATVTETTTKFRFPCGPLDCADAACWNDKRDWPTLNHPVSEPFFPKARQGQRRQAVCRHNPFVAMTVLVQRTIYFPSVNFDRSWHDYENGFGTRGNHWLGLKHIHRLSTRGTQVASIVIQDDNRNWFYKTWYMFYVDSAVNRYALYLGKSSERPDIMESARGHSFYTRDLNITNGKQTCGSRFRSGWWFGKCSGKLLDLINLNGRFNATYDTKIFAGPYSIRYAILSMRPIHYNELTYRCDKSCPNGGTCVMASDKLSYACHCAPMYTGWRCESYLSNAPPTRPRVQAPILLTETTTWKDNSDEFVTGYSYFLQVLMGMSVIILLLTIIRYYIFWNRDRTKTTHELYAATCRNTSGGDSDDADNNNLLLPPPPELERSKYSAKSKKKLPLFYPKNSSSGDVADDYSQKPFLRRLSTRVGIIGNTIQEKTLLFLKKQRANSGDSNIDDDDDDDEDMPLLRENSLSVNDSPEDYESHILSHMKSTNVDDPDEEDLYLARRNRSAHFHESVVGHDEVYSRRIKSPGRGRGHRDTSKDTIIGSILWMQK